MRRRSNTLGPRKVEAPRRSPKHLLLKHCARHSSTVALTLQKPSSPPINTGRNKAAPSISMTSYHQTVSIPTPSSRICAASTTCRTHRAHSRPHQPQTISQSPSPILPLYLHSLSTPPSSPSHAKTFRHRLQTRRRTPHPVPNPLTPAQLPYDSHPRFPTARNPTAAVLPSLRRSIQRNQW